MPSNLKSILSSIRYREALIFQTPTVMGLALFLPAVSLDAAADVLLACLGSFLVAASILAVNDWADIKLDSQHSLKRKDTFLERGINPNQMLALAVSLAAGGLIFFAALSGLHVAVALVAIVLGLAYSVPVGALRGKSLPVFSSLLHFGGTLLSFLLGALTFATDDWRSLLVASYPAVLITAGHLVQEVEDYEQDRLSRCQTNAVRFGRKPVLILASLLFGLSFLLLGWLAEKGFFPGVIKYTSILYLAYVALATRAYRAGLTRDSVRRLRDQYRILFAVVVLAMLIGSLLNKWVLS
jgi:4-hydroxybenzoate polyprenyltransferase